MAPSSTTSEPTAAKSDPHTHSSSTSFIIPGSTEGALYFEANPDARKEKFKAFLDAFERANNFWFKEYSGLQCINRAGFSTAGKEALVAINSHRVLKFPTAPIYQYDVSVPNHRRSAGLLTLFTGHYR